MLTSRLCGINHTRKTAEASPPVSGPGARKSARLEKSTRFLSRYFVVALHARAASPTFVRRGFAVVSLNETCLSPSRGQYKQPVENRGANIRQLRSSQRRNEARHRPVVTNHQNHTR